jgi:hypothetical protein
LLNRKKKEGGDDDDEKKNSLLRTYVVAKYTQTRIAVVKDKLSAAATKEHKQNGRNFSSFFF